jgi:hypothetical protein
LFIRQQTSVINAIRAHLAGSAERYLVGAEASSLDAVSAALHAEAGQTMIGLPLAKSTEMTDLLLSCPNCKTIMKSSATAFDLRSSRSARDASKTFRWPTMATGLPTSDCALDPSAWHSARRCSCVGVLNDRTNGNFAVCFCSVLFSVRDADVAGKDFPRQARL